MTDILPDLFKGLTPEEALQTLAFGSPMTVASGAELFRLGDPADRIYVIQRGRIHLTLPMEVRGREENILVEERNPGQTVGWSALIPPFRFTLTAAAPLDTELIAFSRQALREHFAAHPAVGYAVSINLAAVIGQRLQLFQTMWLREMQRTVELHCA
jgi:CRP/FNR family transcriptional regulator, cyclic AMP receptor protein